MKKYKDTFKLLCVLALLWVVITTSIQRFKCTNMSETELFLMIPENFVLQFDRCY